jgi:DNA-binding response OmpR family regulator
MTVAVARSPARRRWRRSAPSNPDVVLLDVMLPGINGFDILQRVRQNATWQQIAIIMLTAKGRDVEVAKGLALGANAYVTKPFSTRDLLAEVRRCLNAGENHDTRPG